MSKSEKEFDIKVMRLMRDNGQFDHMNAQFLSEVACAIQKSDFESLRPYKTLRETPDDALAAELVLNYLKKHNMQYTLACVTAETNRRLESISKSRKTQLKLKGDDPIGALLTEWNELGRETVEANSYDLKDDITAYVDDLKKVSTPKRSSKK